MYIVEEDGRLKLKNNDDVVIYASPLVEEVDYVKCWQKLEARAKEVGIFRMSTELQYFVWQSHVGGGGNYTVCDHEEFSLAGGKYSATSYIRR